MRKSTLCILPDEVWHLNCKRLAAGLLASALAVAAARADSGPLTANNANGNQTAVDGERYTASGGSAWLATDGKTLTGGAGNILVNTGGNGMSTNNGGIINASGFTVDASGNGLSVDGAAGGMFVSNGTVTAGSWGISAYVGSHLTGSNLHISAENGEGAMLKWGGQVDLTDSTIISAKRDGMQLVSDCDLKLKNVTINSYICGVRSTSGKSTADMENVTITTQGVKSGYAIQADTGSVFTVKNADLTTHSSQSRGVYAAQGSLITLTGTINITTKSFDAQGLLARYANNAAYADDTRIIADADSVLNITIEGGNILLASNGVQATTVGGDLHDSYIELYGRTNITLAAGSSGNAFYSTGTNTHITTAGGTINSLTNNGRGFFADSGLIDGTQLTLTTADGDLAAVRGSGTVRLANSALTSSGTGSLARLATSGSDRAHLSLADSTLATTGGDGFIVDEGSADGTADIELRNLNLTIGDGRDILNVSATTTANLTADHTALVGNLAAADDATVNIVLNNNSALTGSATGRANLTLGGAGDLLFLTGNSSFGTLSVGGGPVDFRAAPDFATLDVNELTGSGEFIMKTDLAAHQDATEQGVHSDFLTINGDANGDHTIAMHNQGAAPAGDTTPLWLVNAANSTGAATFTGAATILAGMNTYDYTIVNGDTADTQYGATTGGGANNWYAVISGTTTSNAGNATLNVTLSPQVMWFADLDTILKRMGELRLAGKAETQNPKTENFLDNIWVRTHAARLDMRAKVSGDAFREHTYGLDLGADKTWQPAPAATLSAGAYLGYSRADQDYRARPGDGRSHSYHGGLYATWLHRDGWYADLVAKAQYFDTTFNTRDGDERARGDYGNWGLGASLELGRQFTLRDGWFLEPQLQAAHAHIFGTDYTTSGGNNFHVRLGSADILQLRAGAVLGRDIELTPRATLDHPFPSRDRLRAPRDLLQPYLKISAVEQTSSGGKIRSGQQQWRPNLDGTRAEVGAGLVWQVGARRQFHFDYEAAFGDKYTKPWGLTAGYRYQF